jgi:hypothetical protein
VANQCASPTHWVPAAAAGEPKIGPGVRFFLIFFSKFDHPVLHPGGEGRAQSSSKFHPQFFFPEGALATCERSPCREARDGPWPQSPRSLFLTMEFTPMWHGAPIIGNITAVDLEHCRRWLRLLEAAPEIPE